MSINYIFQGKKMIDIAVLKLQYLSRGSMQVHWRPKFKKKKILQEINDLSPDFSNLMSVLIHN